MAGSEVSGVNRTDSHWKSMPTPYEVKSLDDILTLLEQEKQFPVAGYKANGGDYVFLCFPLAIVTRENISAWEHVEE